MTMRLDLVVPGGFGGGWEARAGEYVTIIDLEGEQTGDFVAFVADDPEEWLSPVHCREALRSIFVHEGDRLVSNRRRAILEIVHDDVGVHDATIPACDPTRYAVEFGVLGHRNCLENLWGSVRERGVSIERMPEPLNLFQNTPIVGDGRIGLTDPLSRPGQRIVLQPLVDVFGSLSPCPQDIIPGNGLVPTPMRIVVGDAPLEG
ncbi:MAG TPA: urea carboxylase-associated family protein [Candidatus Limnocylindrales bacterium]|jgi:hypothetical protein|nr:urea carboxylase-associated family protein [Candidatus Limnocylindrales bacterium]